MSLTTVLVTLSMLILIAIVVLAKSPDDGGEFDRLLKSGADFRRKGFHTTAADTFTRAIEIRPKDYRGYEERGTEYITLKEYKKAVEDLSKAIGYKNNRAELFALRAKALSDANNLEKAAEDYLSAARLEEDEELLQNLSVIYYKMEKYHEAIQSISKAIVTDPEKEEYYLIRGNCYYSLKEYDKAVGDYSDALRLNGDDTKVFNARGLAYLAMKDFDNAVKDFSEWVKSNPNDPIAVYNLGTAYLRKNSYDNAIGIFNDLLQIMPDDKQALKGLAVAYLKTGQLDEAENKVDVALRREREDANLFLLQGCIWLAKGDKKNFYFCLEKASRCENFSECKFDDSLYDLVREEEKFQSMTLR